MGKFSFDQVTDSPAHNLTQTAQFTLQVVLQASDF